MDARLQRRVQRYGWDKASAFYERYWSRQLEPAQSAVLTLAALTPGERVLDVACGTGLVTFPAATRVGAGGVVVGTDLSAEMVERGRTAAAERGLAHVRFERMDAEALTVGDAAFDAALCSLGLMYCPDPIAALTQMYRAVGDGGRAVAAVWGHRAACGWADIFPIVDARVNTDVCPLFFQLGGRDALSTAFESAGFADIDTRRISTLLRYESPEAACGAAFAGGPVALAYSRFDDATREEAHAAYLTSIAPFRTNGHYDIPGEFVIARGWRRGPAKGGS